MNEIPYGYCHCGCGEKTNLSPCSNARRGYKKDQPYKFINGHQFIAENNPRWKGGIVMRNGYKWIYMPGHPRALRRYILEHIYLAEKALGKPLPQGVQVHHHNETQLVVCQDQAYHRFLHQRQRAYKACGHANWLKCVYCKQYDDPTNLHVYYGHPNNTGLRGYHPNCMSKHSKRRALLESGAVILED